MSISFACGRCSDSLRVFPFLNQEMFRQETTF